MANSRDPLLRSLSLLNHLIENVASDGGIRDIARALRMSPSTVHRLLSGLVRSGLVVRRDGGTYALSPEMIRLSYLVIAHHSFERVALPHMRELVKTTKETSALGLYDSARGEMMLIATVESSQPLRHVIQMRSWMPVYAGASGLAIMAFLPGEERKAIITRTRLARITERTITDRYTLEYQLERIRRDGYASSVGQRTPGAVAVGAPIFGPNGNVVGDVIVTLPEQRFDRSREGYLAEQVMRCAHAITRDLGGATEINGKAAPQRDRADVRRRLWTRPKKQTRQTGKRTSISSRS